MVSLHTSPAQIKAINESVDGLLAIDVGLGGQMGVPGRSQQADVAENLLQLEKINPSLQQVGCIAVAKGVA